MVMTMIRCVIVRAVRARGERIVDDFPLVGGGEREEEGGGDRGREVERKGGGR